MSARHMSPVSSYINLFSEKYFTQIICREQARHRSVTLVSCFNTNLLFPVYNLMYIKGCYFDNDKYTIGFFFIEKTDILEDCQYHLFPRKNAK